MIPISPAEAVARARTVPDRFRSYTATAGDASRAYAISADLLEELLDLGLPGKTSGGNILLDPVDLENCSTNLRTDSPQWAVLNIWKKHLGSPRSVDGGTCEIRIAWRCPTPGHPGDCAYLVDPRLTDPEAARAHHQTSSTTLTITANVAGQAHDLGESFKDVAGAAQEITYHKLPDALASDLRFLQDTGLADCRLAGLHLTAVAQEAGFTARAAQGYFLGIPFPAPHAWFEVRVGRRWVAADPFFLNTLHQWGVMDARTWPLTHSPRNVFWRTGVTPPATAPAHTPLVLHLGRPAPASLMARWKAPACVQRPHRQGVTAAEEGGHQPSA
ncbi:transglutaminase domain-containing protein [Streptomyces sp. NPDC056004]|uniref:transglutaminase domain-containing protein n=1 Tax=Streptomyces sp. NPDC056004 TaxID=3345677 RepID=UPI0035DD364B